MMATVPLTAEILEDGARPRDWEPRRVSAKGPLRILRLCVLGTFLPAALVTGPMYLRYKVYSEQLYPLAASDQRLIDAKVSTTWCQRQLVKVNGTFNAYLLNRQPEIRVEAVPVSMTRHLVLEDDMKEYWGFYLLRGSNVTVSTCVRWPGASLTIIRGHKHLHECAFIGDDSSEELEELVEIAEESGLKLSSAYENSTSNEPGKMKRVRQGVEFHDEASSPSENNTIPGGGIHHLTSHELDAKTMRNILTHLFAKTLETKRKQEENPHHHYEGTFRESSNIDRPPILNPDDFGGMMLVSEEEATEDPSKKKTQVSKPSVARRESGEQRVFSTTADPGKEKERPTEETATVSNPPVVEEKSKEEISSTTAYPGIETTRLSSDEVFEEVLAKLEALGSRGKNVLQKLMDEIGPDECDKSAELRKMVDEATGDKGSPMTDEERARKRREIILSSPLNAELNEDDSEGDAAIEEGVLNPDGIAEDRGTVNETTLNDRSNSEFWSSFSSSEERLLECNGLILNLPLTPNRHCTPKYENEHVAASLANTVTYRVPSNGYYFFVFNSENEIQPNYIRIRFDLQKTEYDTSNPTQSCENSTSECSLPLNFFSDQKAVLELPLTGNDSQWNEEYVVVSTCEPRTAIYIFCILSVPLLVLIFAFH